MSQTESLSNTTVDHTFRYRDEYRGLMRWIIILVIMALGQLVVLGFLMLHPNRIKNYVTTTAGQVVPIHALSEPVLTDKYLLMWASILARRAFNYDFVNYGEKLAEIKPYFTDNGWNVFKDALKKSGMVKQLVANHVMMQSIVSGPPVIINKMIMNHRFTWVIQLPLLVSYNSANAKQTRRLIVTMSVQRVPVVSVSQGILVNDFMTQVRY